MIRASTVLLKGLQIFFIHAVDYLTDNVQYSGKGTEKLYSLVWIPAGCGNQHSVKSFKVDENVPSTSSRSGEREGSG